MRDDGKEVEVAIMRAIIKLMSFLNHCQFYDSLRLIKGVIMSFIPLLRTAALTAAVIVLSACSAPPVNYYVHANEDFFLMGGDSAAGREEEALVERLAERATEHFVQPAVFEYILSTSESGLLQYYEGVVAFVSQRGRYPATWEKGWPYVAYGHDGVRDDVRTLLARMEREGRTREIKFVNSSLKSGKDNKKARTAAARILARAAGRLVAPAISRALFERGSARLTWGYKPEALTGVGELHTTTAITFAVDVEGEVVVACGPSLVGRDSRRRMRENPCLLYDVSQIAHALECRDRDGRTLALDGDFYGVYRDCLLTSVESVASGITVVKR
jgi:hypothetical protein